MEHEILSYTGVIGVGMALFLIQKFWVLSNKFSAIEATQNIKLETLKNLEHKIEDVNKSISDLKIQVNRIRIQ